MLSSFLSRERSSRKHGYQLHIHSKRWRTGNTIKHVLLPLGESLEACRHAGPPTHPPARSQVHQARPPVRTHTGTHAGTHAHTPARPRARALARTHARTHACTHSRTYARAHIKCLLSFLCVGLFQLFET